MVKLIDVKSIMTLALTTVFCILALTGVISGQGIITIFTVIVGFYFGTQVQTAAAANTAIQYGNAVGTVVVEQKRSTEAEDEVMAYKIHLPNGEKEQSE